MKCEHWFYPPLDCGSTRGLRRRLGAATQVSDHADDHQHPRDPGRAAVNLQVVCIKRCVQHEDVSHDQEFGPQDRGPKSCKICFTGVRACQIGEDKIGVPFYRCCFILSQQKAPLMTEPTVFHCEIFFTFLCVWYVLHLMCHAAKSDASNCIVVQECCTSPSVSMSQ